MPITVNGNPLNTEIIISFIQKNEVLNAVKWTREQTGIGLKGAHEIVSNLANNHHHYDNIDYTITNDKAKFTDVKSYSEKFYSNEIIVDGHTFDGNTLIPLLKENQNLKAIMYVKEVTGLGLKESKDIVEKLSKSQLIQQNIFKDTLNITNLPKDGKNLLQQLIDGDQTDGTTSFSSFENSDLDEIMGFGSNSSIKNSTQNLKKNKSKAKKGSHFIKTRSFNTNKIILIAAIIGLIIYAFYYFNGKI